MTNPRAQELKNAMNAVFGKDTVRMGSDPKFVVTCLPTGVLPIDVLLDGGIPRGRFIEIFGAFSSLKSYIGLKCIAETQKSGGVCALLDTEHAFDPEWATSLGVDVNDLILPPTPNGETAIDEMEALIRAEADLVVWDSVAASLPKAEEASRSVDKTQMARLAAMMSAGLRKMNTANSKTAVFCINQTRINVGQIFGNPEAIPGGKSLPFYASLRISMRPAGKLTRDIRQYDGEKWVTGKEVHGYKIKSTIEKSKLSAPHRDVTFVFDLETASVDQAQYLVTLGVESGVVTNKEKSQSWEIPELDLSIRGRDKFKKTVRENQSLQDWLLYRILPDYYPGASPPPKPLASSLKPASSKQEDIEPTLEAEPEESSKTAPTKTKSLKSSKRVPRSRSTVKP